jgi:hypothetical protein
MAESSPPVRPDPPTERRGGYPANGVKIGDLPKPPKEATVGPAANPGTTPAQAETPTAHDE